MRLNLREIAQVPGGQIPFRYEKDLSDLPFDSVAAFHGPLAGKGVVRNTAGVLVLTADVSVEAVCVCARCLAEFERQMPLHVEAVLADELQDEENPDIYLLDGDDIDVDEVILTAFVLNMEQRFLCREDCQGLCEKCGKNLNDGPCQCRAETDPRLAALQQLLENE